MFHKRMKSVLPVIMMFLFMVTSSLAQIQDTRPQENDMYRQNAERWTQTLNNRLTLTDDQQTRINSILVDYQTRRTQLGVASEPTTLQNDVNRQIEGVLDDNQRMNWDTYSTEWWNEINRGADTDTDFDRQIDNDMDRDTEIPQEGTDADTNDDDQK